MEERFRAELLNRMAIILSAEQIEILDNVLTSMLCKYAVEEVKNEIVSYDGGNDKMINQFMASMRLEGKSEATLEQYHRAIIALLDDVGKKISDITTNDIRYHLAMYQKNRSVSKVTIDNKRRYLSAFFTWLTTEEYIPKNPMLRIKKVKQDKKIKKPFSDKELERIREAAKSKRDKAIVEFLLSTGCRVSEVVNLDLEHINFAKNECIVMGKGNKERKVYISEKSMYYLTEYISSRTDMNPSLFVNKRGKRLKKQGIEDMLKKIGKSAGVNKVHPHRFRRTFATNALNKGMPIQHVQRLMGHKSLDTTMIYCTLDDDSIKLEHKKIA